MMIKFQMQQILVAGVLLTRLPLPALPPAAFAEAGRAVWAYPVIGAVLGLIAVLTGKIALGLGLDTSIAGGLVLATLMLTTGAMHEDGLADCADGFWGGNDKARRLEIMRDSQIGTYGTLALIVVVMLRWSAFTALIWLNIWAVVAAAALSRAMMPWVMQHLPLARDDGLSRSVGCVPTRAAAQAALIGGIIGVVFMGWSALIAGMAAVAVSFGMIALARTKIGGQTGDVLGAVQQLSEVAILITFLTVV